MKKYFLLLFVCIMLACTVLAQKLIPFSTGTAYNYLWGFKDATGKIVVEPIYTKCPYFYNGFAVVVIKEKKGLIDINAKPLTEVKYDDIANFISDGLFMVAISRNYGFIDTAGKEVIPLVYSDANDFKSGCALVSQDKKKFFIDKTGKNIIALEDYEETHKSFSEGLCGVKKAGKWGFINVSGKIIIPCKYDKVEPMKEGFSLVIFGGKPGEYGQLKGGKYTFIDKTGKQLVPFKYAYLAPFNEGIAVVNIGGKLDVYGYASGGKWGYINKTGKEITPIKYTISRSSSEGLAAVNIGGTFQDDHMGGNTFVGGKWGYVDSKGKEVIALVYDKAGEFYDGKATVIKNGMSVTINKKGVIVN